MCIPYLSSTWTGTVFLCYFCNKLKITSQNMSPGTPRLHLEEYKLKQDPQDYGIADDIWDLERFKRQFKIVIVR